jgi:hypothetical protein
MTDHVTLYGPQATTRFTCPYLVPFQHELSKKKKNNYGKITEISASFTFLNLPMEQR